MTRQQEKDARAYCLACGDDPDEHVFGYNRTGFRVSKPRWQWYVRAPQNAHKPRQIPTYPSDDLYA